MIEYWPDKLRLARKSLHGRVIPNAIASTAAYGASLVLRKPIVWGMPPIVMIEPTSACNLRCPLCPSGAQELTRPKGFINLDLYKKIIDQIAPTTMDLILWNQGEPFLHPEFYEMVEYATRKGLYTMTSTNANLPIDANRLIDSGLDRLIVSMDGATQETYSKYRVGGEIERILDNLRHLQDARRRKRSKIPFIRLQFLVMKHNEHELDAIRRIARETGCDMLEFKTVQIYREEDIEQYLPTNPAYRRYTVGGGHFSLKHGVKNRCRRIWTQPVANWNGDMAMCCYDKDIQYKIGNLNEQTFAEIWHGKKLNKLRAAILKNRAAMPVCNNCGEGVSLSVNLKGK
jgi:radical SAM protein with 4Fe4S-binding SPASM domain